MTKIEIPCFFFFVRFLSRGCTSSGRRCITIMSDGIQSGFRNAVIGILEGIILSAVLGIIPQLQLVPSYYVGIIQLIEAVYLVGGILVILAMESWGFWYLIGWLFGMWIMSTAGLVESWLFIVYAVVGVPALIGKTLQKARSSL